MKIKKHAKKLLQRNVHEQFSFHYNIPKKVTWSHTTQKIQIHLGFSKRIQNISVLILFLSTMTNSQYFFFMEPRQEVCTMVDKSSCMHSHHIELEYNQIHPN